ncbi:MULTISPECIES: DUF5995 family protein [Kitasatospora]|uniref:DUF5995 family protein n=1 Tax=Kitasatospora cystarginea TaxID=58350 RepID=A0ABP5QCZ9_9ACTN
MTTTDVLTIDQVISRMRDLAERLPQGDGIEVFNAMYLTVTELVRDRLATAYFDDPAGMARLDAVFAARFLSAVDTADSGGAPEACWRPLFELRGNPGIHPIQFALAGMNAHIENDLPLSVLDCCRVLGLEPKDAEADYHRINDLLAEVESQVRDELLPGPERLRIADPLLHVIGVWSIDRARDAAWASVLGLWELRRAPLAYETVTTALSDSVGMVSRALLTPFDGH